EQPRPDGGVLRREAELRRGIQTHRPQQDHRQAQPPRLGRYRFHRRAAQGLLHQTGIHEDAVDALAFGLDELAEGLTGQEVRLPAQALHYGVPFLALAELGETLDPFAVVVFRHVDRTEHAPPVGNFDVKTRFLEGGNLGGTLHAFSRRYGQDTDAAAFGKLLELGDARQAALQGAIHNARDGVGAARLRNIVQLADRNPALLRKQRQGDMV